IFRIITDLPRDLTSKFCRKCCTKVIMSGYGMTTLTMKEEKRLEIIQRVFRGELTVVKAGMGIGVSKRQGYRIKARVAKRGGKGVVHGNRGRACKHKTKEKEVKRVVELAKGKYRGFNDRHLTEKLVEQEKLEISREKVSGQRQNRTTVGNFPGPAGQ